MSAARKIGCDFRPDPFLTNATVSFRASNSLGFIEYSGTSPGMANGARNAKAASGGLMETLTNDSMSDRHPFGLLAQIYVHGQCLTKDHQG